MSMGGVSSRDKLQSDINVTPLVDVCLVLLIIFMVVTPLLQKGIAVQLPTTDNPDKKPENASQKLLTVGWATPPAYYFEADKLSKNDVKMSKEAGFQNVGLIADKKQKGASPKS